MWLFANGRHRRGRWKKQKWVSNGKSKNIYFYNIYLTIKSLLSYLVPVNTKLSQTMLSLTFNFLTTQKKCHHFKVGCSLDKLRLAQLCPSLFTFSVHCNENSAFADILSLYFSQKNVRTQKGISDFHGRCRLGRGRHNVEILFVAGGRARFRHFVKERFC